MLLLGNSKLLHFSFWWSYNERNYCILVCMNEFDPFCIDMSHMSGQFRSYILVSEKFKNSDTGRMMGDLFFTNNAVSIV